MLLQIDDVDRASACEQPEGRRDRPRLVLAVQTEGNGVEATVEEFDTVRAIGAAHPDWVRGQRNAADPFIIAAAFARAAVIVTVER